MATDKAALEALYDATGGSSWTTSTNWKTAEPLSEWHGVTTDTNGRVAVLDLKDNGLNGSIPAALGGLTNLQNLYLYNNQLSGTIPTQLGQLTHLTLLQLQNNQLTGSIPVGLGGLANLQWLLLQNNQLSGSIPTRLGQLTHLTLLQLYNNQLTGSIPAALGGLANLQWLLLENNQLSGTIPTRLGQLTNLTNLRLHNNQLTGSIPAALGGLANLQWLYLYNNQLTGSIPSELGQLANLTELRLNNNELTGEIPVALGSLTNLQWLFLHNNELTGSIPSELGGLTNLLYLYLYNNELDGEIPGELGQLANLQWLYLYNNELDGEIPSELGSLTSLQRLQLQGNQLDGEIPGELGQLANLWWLILYGNELSGSIPAQLGSLTNLQYLYLHNNELSGSIPTQLGSLTNLLYLYLYNNQLSGSIPAQLGSLTSLQRLYLDNNGLDGSIPTQLGGLTNLLHLYLYNNQLSGSIPTQLGGLANLQRLQLQGNELTGTIPSDLGDLANLQWLILYGNELSGSIPAALGGLTNLLDLSLWDNELTGSIPVALGSLTNLQYLDLWGNQLTGEIPAAVGVAADRGALRRFYVVTGGGPDWKAGTNWLSAEPLSAWHGVTTDGNGRVTRVVLTNNQLTGTITVAVEQWENLEQLILSGNDELTGQLPLELSDLSALGTLNVLRTNVCVPTDAAFQAWLATITFQGGTACEPPDAPESLTTMAGNARVTLAWTKGDDGGSTVTKHQIQQKEGNAAYGDWMDIPDSAAGQKNQASHTVTGLTNGTDYAFQVRAVNDAGESGASGEATATPMAVPALTVSVTITAAEIVVDEGRNAEFTLLRSGSAAGALEVELTVIESGDMLRRPVPKRATFPAAAARVTLTVRTVNDGRDERDSVVTVTVGPGTGYEPVSANAFASMRVRDNDRTPPRPPGGGGGGGPRTSAPGAPQNLMAVAGIGQVVLGWDAPASDGGAAITDYEYRIDGQNPWISTGSTETTHTVTGLDNGTAYTFEVRAVNRVGKGRVSSRAEATPEVFTLDFTHFANGDGLTSNLVFVNVGTRPIRPALYFYDTEGALVSAASVVDIMGDLEVTEDGSLSIQTAMEPLGELTIPTHGQGELVSGSVKVVSDGPIGGMLRFDLPGAGVAGVGASPPVRDAVFPARRQAGGINTGVAIHNLGSSAELVRCELMREGVLQDAASIPLAANGQTSWFIDAAFTAADTSDFAGSVHCDAAGPGMFTAVALELDAVNRLFTTLPVLPVRRAGGRAAELNFAHFANGAGITSDLVFVNLSTERSRPAPTPFHTDILPARPAIYFYDTEGEPMAAESVVDITGDLAVTEDGGLTVQTEMEPLGVLTIATHGRGALVSGSVRVIADEPIGGVLRFDLPGIGVAGVGASSPVRDALFPVRRQEGGINTGVAVHNLGEEVMEVTCELMQGGTVLGDVSIPLAANGQSSWFINEVFTGADTSDFAGSVRCTAPGEGMFAGVAVELDAANRIFTTLPVVPIPERADQE